MSACSVGYGRSAHDSRRRGLSNASSSRSSPTTSLASASLPSPPATRTRSRKTSADHTAAPPIHLSSGKGKGKAKQVEFSEDVAVQSASADEESDLTDLTEIEENLAAPATPSPRRLRSKGDKEDTVAHHSAEEAPRRVTPSRKAKVRVGSLRESSSEDEEEDQLAEESEMDEEEQEESANMVTPKPTRRTPLRKRLRPRAHLLTPPSDGDDEGSDDESVDITESIDGDEEEEAQEEAEEIDDVEGEDEEAGSEEGTVVDEDEEAPLSQPRTLRNGKVVGDDLQVDVSDNASEEDQEDDSSADQDSASIDLDADGDTEEEEDEEPMEEDGKRPFQN